VTVVLGFAAARRGDRRRSAGVSPRRRACAARAAQSRGSRPSRGVEAAGGADLCTRARAPCTNSRTAPDGSTGSRTTRSTSVARGPHANRARRRAHRDPAGTSGRTPRPPTPVEAERTDPLPFDARVARRRSRPELTVSPAPRNAERTRILTARREAPPKGTTSTRSWAARRLAGLWSPPAGRLLGRVPGSRRMVPGRGGDLREARAGPGAGAFCGGNPQEPQRPARSRLARSNGAKGAPRIPGTPPTSSEMRARRARRSSRTRQSQVADELPG
jgi:hypothetical protein